MNNVNGLPPFKRLCVTIGNLPSSYVDSMSYYECLMWLCKYLKDTVVPAINENAEAVNELINWFNNLDVQDEIDNKLDEMAESGELQEIISEYLNSTAIFGFNTVADMKVATNLINGSYARTCGKTTFNDGYGALYKIRTITNQDVVDGDKIIAMNDVTLVAEKILSVSDYLIEKDVMIILGDSWSDTSSSQTFIDRNVYPSIVANTLNCVIKNYAIHGAQVAHLGSQFESAIADNTYDHKRVKYIFIEGGLNDLQHGTHYSALITSINGIIENMETSFPNAKFYYIPNLNFPMTNANLGYIQQVENGIRNSKCSVIDVLSQMIGQKYFDSTAGSVVGANNHLSNYGQEIFGRCIADYLSGGNFIQQVYKINITNTSASQGSGSTGTGALYLYKNNTNVLNVYIDMPNITGLASGVNKFNISLGESIISDIVQTTFLDDYGMFGNFSITSGIMSLTVQKNSSNTNCRIKQHFEYPIGLTQSI